MYRLVSFICQLFILLYPISGYAQKGKGIVTLSESVKRIYQDAEARDLVLDDTGLINISTICPGKQLLLIREGQLVRDVGISLFSEEIERGNIPEVYSFIERYFLSLSLKVSNAEQMNLLKEDFVLLLVDGKSLEESSFSMTSLLAEISTETSFRLTAQDLHYEACWSLPKGKELKFSFPKQYDLILGMDKKELVYTFRHALESLEDVQPKEEYFPQFFQYDTIKKMYMESDGYYILPQVASGKYFYQKGVGYEYIFQERQGEKSLQNLFAYADEMGKKNPVHLTIKGYKLSETFDYSVERLCTYMKAHSCKAYTGIESVTESEYTGTVFYVNTNLQYKHLLYFTFPIEAFKSDTVPIVATLYPYIPINNIGTLYEDGLPESISH